MAVSNLVVHTRFNGPPNSGNGGYVCGLVGNLIDGDAEVMLRQPPPLAKPLAVSYDDGGVVRLLDGQTVVAIGRPAEWSLAIPAPPTMEEAVAAASRYAGFRHHVFPTCFVCGTERHEGDGLQLFPGKVDGRDLVAAPWVPHEAFAGADGVVPAELLWSALDCPGGWAVLHHLGPAAAVLGKLSARISRPVRAGQTYTVIGWWIRSDGRKHEAGSALFAERGELCAAGYATWITLREPGK